MGPEQFGPEDVDRDDLDAVETTDEVWPRAGDRAGGRWLLLLLVIPVVALVVLQARPVGEPVAGPTPTSSSTSPASGRTGSSVDARAKSLARPVVQDLGHSVLGASREWELYVREDHAVVRLQMVRGRVTTTMLPGLASSGPVAFLATSSGDVVRPLDSVVGYRVANGRPARQLEGLLDQGGPVIPGPDPEHLWVQEASNGTGPEVIRLTTADGSPTHTRVRMPANADGFIAADGGGYPLVTTAGGAYSLRPDGPRRITTGTVAAVGPTGWLVVECDAANRCARVVVDRGTGKRARLPGRVDAPATASGLISPDGSRAVVAGTDQDSANLWLIDLHSGQRHAITLPGRDDFDPAGAAAWSPDGRWVLFAFNSTLLALNAQTHEVEPLQPSMSRVHQIAVHDPK